MRKRDHSGLLTVLATILVIALLGGVAYGTHRLTYKPAAPAQTPASAAPTQAPAAAQPTAEPTAEPAAEPVHEHTWAEATCTEPRTCTECGETEGEPLGHDLQPADYWSPGICLRCGVELAPVLTPDFELRDLSVNMELGETASYVTVCGPDSPESVTVGKATVTRYDIMASGEDVESIPGKTWTLPEKDGYEWRIFSIEIVFSDENAQQYGMNIKTAYTDYYVIEPWVDEGTEEASHNGSTHQHSSRVAWSEDNSWYEGSFDVTYRGEEYACRRVYDGGFDDWNAGSRTFHLTEAVQVPVGYDGYVFILYDAAHGAAGTDWTYVYDMADEDTLFFRAE